MDLYRDEILDHYKNPHNFGELPDPKVSYEEYNPLCGDRVVLQLKIENGKLKEVKFTGEGCAISIASASMLTDYLVGKDIAELKSLPGKKVLEVLGLSNIAAGRLKCALLPFEALKKSLAKLS
ncbi:MAG: SUF system NifU family Fe-S cluster assembly protein [Patescibacteria group bacterium]|nr:SUF system NifU family Fe-S cluster assembly protein [Patescibacteria group bacterium]